MDEGARFEAALRLDIQRVESRMKALEDNSGLIYLS
jgi:hypothetical protein